MSQGAEGNLRRHHHDICKILDASPSTLESFTGALYQKGIVNGNTKREVFRLMGYKGADTLLDYILLRVEYNPRLIEDIIEVMRKEEALDVIVAKLKAECSQPSKNMPKISQRTTGYHQPLQLEPAAVAAASMDGTYMYTKTGFQQRQPLLLTPAAVAVKKDFASPAVESDVFIEQLSQDQRWYTLGILLGVPTHKLDIISINYGSIRECLGKLYKCCMELEGGVSWAQIVEALRKMDNSFLAGIIYSKYISPSPLSESEDSVQNRTKAVEVPTEVVQGYKNLSLQFSKLKHNVRQSIRQSNISIDDLQNVIRDECSFEPLCGKEATVDNFLNRLSQYYSLLDVLALEFIFKTLFDKDHPVQRQLTEYIEFLDKFKSSAEMKHLVYLLKQQQTVNSGHKLVKLKVREFWSGFTVKKFEKVLRDILQTLHSYTSHIKVKKGCICISWVIPDMDTSKLISPQPLEFLKIIGVVYLHIGDEVVYSLPKDGCDTLEAAMLQAVELKNTQAIELLQAVGSDTNDIITKSVDNVVTVVSSVTDSSDTGAVVSSTGREQVPVVSTHSQSIQEPLSTQPGHHSPENVFTQEERFQNTDNELEEITDTSRPEDQHLEIQKSLLTEKLKQKDEQEMDAAIFLEHLKDEFEEILLAVMRSCHETDVYNLRLRLNWFISVEGHCHSLYDNLLCEIESIQDAPNLLNFLIRRRLIGFLNYKLVEVFVKASGSNPAFKSSVDHYEAKYLKLFQFDFPSIIEALQDPDLVNVPPVGLPKFKVYLGKEWEGERAYNWKVFFENRFSWPRHLLIDKIEKSRILIQYAVLPFFVSAVVRDLTDPLVIAELRQMDVRVELSAELKNIPFYDDALEVKELKKRLGEDFPTLKLADIAEFMRIQDLSITRNQMYNLVVETTCEKDSALFELGKGLSVLVIDKGQNQKSVFEFEHKEDLQQDLQLKTLEVEELKKEVASLKKELKSLCLFVEQCEDREAAATLRAENDEHHYNYVTLLKRSSKPHQDFNISFQSLMSIGSSGAPPPVMATLGHESAHPLKTNAWYWGKLSLEDVGNMLRDTPDGTYLVCDSEGPGRYALTVRDKGQNRLIRIYCLDGMYGFSRMQTFWSVPELIEHHSKVSLSQDKRRLYLKLKNPVSKFAQIEDGSENEDSNEITVLLTKLNETTQHFNKKFSLYQLLLKKSKEAKMEVERANSVLKARRNIVEMLDEHLKSHNFIGHTNEDIADKLWKNVYSITEKLKEAKNLHKLAEKYARVSNDCFRSTAKELNALRPELIALKWSKDQYTCKLVVEGLTHHDISLHVMDEASEDNDDIIDQELDKSVFENVSEPIQRPRPTQLLLSHAPYRMLSDRPMSPPPIRTDRTRDSGHPGLVRKPSLQSRSHKYADSVEKPLYGRQDTWYEECDRKEAEKYLKDKPNGTFLCRPAGKAQPNAEGGTHTHTVDLVYNGLEHIKIFQDKGKYGFAIPCLHSSLLELIVHYSEYSLEIYNPKLTTTLAYPLNRKAIKKK